MVRFNFYQYHSDILLTNTMNFSPLFTSTWDSSKLDGMLQQLTPGQEHLSNVSMAEEDYNVGENTINLSDTKVDNTINVDSDNTIDISDSQNTMFESTINITDKDTIENVTDME